MTQQQKSSDDINTQNYSECEKLKQSYQKNNSRLEFLEEQRDQIYNSGELDVEKLGVINQEYERINEANLSIRYRLRKLKCDDISEETSLDDTQTIIATSSVRRKDMNALERKAVNVEVG